MATGRTVAENIKLSLGLVGTTVNFKSRRASEKSDSFKRICPDCASKGAGIAVKQANICPTCDGHFTVPECAKGKEIVKATKNRKGEIVPLTTEEIEHVRSCEAATGKSMELHFHPAGQVAHLIPTGISYACVPGDKPDAFYGVLANQLGNPQLVCMGKLVMGGKEKVFRVTVASTGLVVSEMCRDAEVYDVPVTDTSFDDKYLGLAGQLIEMVTADYNPEVYRDRTAERLAELLAAKAADPGATISVLPAPKAAEPEIDMLAMMEASLAALKAGKGEAA